MEAQFERATRLKLRFDSQRGMLSAEDLWDLPLTSNRTTTPNLNDIAKGINRELKAVGEEDFVNPAGKADDILTLKLDLVKHVISVRMAENEAARSAADRKAKKAQLLEVIERKQNQALESTPLEELQKMVEAL